MLRKIVTPSGVGEELIIDSARPPLEPLAKELIETAKRSGFALVQGLELDRADFISLVHSAGATAEHHFGTGSAELLDLDADPDPQKVVTGRAFLPLHTDGALVGTYPNFIILYCVQFDQSAGSGETQICHQQLALTSMPEKLRKLFDQHWEYYVHDASHFPTIARRWISIKPIIQSRDGFPTLNVALPFQNDDERPGWSVRLPGMEPSASASLFEELDSYLRSSEAYYSHRWNIGDLLVIDNTRVLHGRSAITGDGARHLYRGQLQ